MPAMLDDPNSPTIYRTSGTAPFPDPHDPHPALPEDVFSRQVTLRDRVTIATIIPFSSQLQVPLSLLVYLCDMLNREIEKGDTYPMIETMPVEKFATYWFQNFAAVVLLGNGILDSADGVLEDRNWATECLGSYYIKPNYPGRSSHICNAGFLVTDAVRNKGVGRLMGESYLAWAPKLGYSYSVFNLVYETNVASCRIWDALGFKRIGRVRGAGNLKGHGELVDAIMYGRDLGPEGEDFVSEERFDKIKYYLKHGKYPDGADRAEKSRLRSAATHYRLLPDSDKLMLKDKEVVSDPQKQYEIAKNVHMQQHGGINKSTATIAEKYHWVRIKETVSLVIRNCTQCKELGKTPVIVRGDGVIRPPPREPLPTSQDTAAAARLTQLTQDDHSHVGFLGHAGHGSVSPQVLNRKLPGQDNEPIFKNTPPQQAAPIARMQNEYLPLDPGIMEDVRKHLGGYNHKPLNSPSPDHHHFHGGDHDQHDSDSFQAMLGGDRGHGREADGNEDMDMLIDAADDDGHEHGQDHDDKDVAIQLQAEAASRAANEALNAVGREYGRDRKMA